jgi:tungstate transport system substrate-binding protein
VFSNTLALIGPSDDPAGVRGLADPIEAFRRIAQTKSRFVVNSSGGVKYAEDIVAKLANVTRPWSGYTEPKLEGPEAARAAAEARAYTLWGLPPFLRFKRQGELKALEALVVGSPLLQRMMVSVVVNGAKVQGVNVDGARRFEQFLLTPDTQAAVESFRYPDFARQAWWAAGRHNQSRE